MINVQIIDCWKASMKIASYEMLQAEEFDTTQALLFRAQPVEVDNAVLYAWKGESFTDRAALSTSNFDSSTSSTCWNLSFNSPITSKLYSTFLYPLPLLSASSNIILRRKYTWCKFMFQKNKLIYQHNMGVEQAKYVHT